MNLKEYREEFLQDIGIMAEIEMTDVNTEFLKKATEILIDATEFSDFKECYFEGVGKGRKSIQIDGFSVEEIDGTYLIFITDYRGVGDENEVLTKTQIDILYKKMAAFVENSINGYLSNDIEESGEAYEFIKDIEENIDNIRKFRFYILTDAFLSSRVKNIKEPDICGKNVDLNVWDMNRFFMLANSKLGKESVEIIFEKYDYEGIPTVKAASYKNAKVDVKIDEDGIEKYEIAYDSYLAVIPGRILNEIYLEYDARLLEGNVRAFLGFKKINTGIKNTILNSPEMFFAYNNGIAATATEIETIMTPEGLKISKIKDLQIINGGQTTASIANALLNNKNADISSLYVPMKISVLDPKVSEKIIPKISEYANTQNKVNAADFFSNHPFHIRMEEYSRKILANAIDGNQYQTYWFYERARGQYEQGRFRLKKGSVAYKEYERKFPKKQIIKKVDLAKYMNLYHEEPAIVSKGSQKSMVNFAEEINKVWEKNDKVINEIYFKKVVALSILFRDIDRIIKDSLWYKSSNSYKANVIAYSLAYLFYYIRTTHKEHTLDFNKIWEKQYISEALQHDLNKLTKIVFNFITSNKRPVTNVTEWCKRELCWKMAKDEINFEFSEKFIKELISTENEKAEEKEAIAKRDIQNEMELLKEIMELGFEYWKKVFIWGQERNLLTDMDKDILNLVKSIEFTGKILNKKQCKYVIMLRDRLFSEGMPKYI